MDINAALAGAPVGVAAMVMGFSGWADRKHKEAERKADELLYARALAAQLPLGAASISTRSLRPPRTDHSGRIMLVLCGSMAENVGGIQLLTLLDRCGLEGVIGSVLLLELDRRRRDHFLEDVPEVFRDRIVQVNFPGLAGGLGNRSPSEVLDLIDAWGPQVIRGATEVVEIHQLLHFGEEPPLVLAVVSQGGTAITGTKAVETIKRLCPMAKFFGVTALPVDDRLRSRTQEILDAYRAAGVAHFELSDNRGDDVRNDFGVVGGVVGFASAAEAADAAVEQNNAWYLLFEEGSGLVTYSTYVRTLPGYRLEPTHPAVPARYFLNKGTVTQAILTGLKEVERDEYHALLGAGRNGLPPNTSRFDIVLAAVVPSDLKEDEDDILLGQWLKGKDKSNYHLLFAPITAEIDPLRPRCPIAIISLHAIAEPRDILGHLTTTASQTQLPPADSIPKLSRPRRKKETTNDSK